MEKSVVDIKTCYPPNDLDIGQKDTIDQFKNIFKKTPFKEIKKCLKKIIIK